MLKYVGFLVIIGQRHRTPIWWQQRSSRGQSSKQRHESDRKGGRERDKESESHPVPHPQVCHYVCIHVVLLMKKLE